MFIIMSLSLNPSYTWASEQIVELNGDRLTLDVKDQSLAAILRKLGGQGVRIRVDPRINPKISATFNNRPIGSAMSSILKSFNYALIWQEDKASGSGEPRLTEIRVFHEGQEERIRQLTDSTNLNVVQGDGNYYVKDVLLLRLSPTMTEASYNGLLDKLGATVLDKNIPLGIIKLRLPPGTDAQTIARSISDYPGVKTAEPDYAYPLGGDRPILVERLSEPPPAAPAQTTGTTTIAVMDSGLLPGYADSSFISGAYDAVSPGAELDDLVGHGTQMTLIASGVVSPLGVGANTAEPNPVVVIRAIDDNGFTSNYTLIRGIDYAIENDVRVLSLSWGTESSSPLMQSATSYASAKGLILVAAAGNEPTGRPVYPAAYNNVIGVGALTPDGKLWDKSNFGDFVSVQAPGLANLPIGFHGDPGTYAGTSIATAFTARRIAAILDQTPDADLDTVLQKLSTDVELTNELK
jgi:thermitase